MMKKINFLFLCLFLVACGDKLSENLTNEELQLEAPKEINWDALIPEGYSPEVLMKKYEEQTAQLEDDDPKIEAIYQRFMDEMNNAPLNEQMNGQWVKLPGFIAPLNSEQGKIVEFLFVPYFGACIHVPPPPINQTILVTVAEGYGIDTGDVFLPIWVSGQLHLEGKKTDIGEAGYSINNAIIDVYEEDDIL